MRQITPPTVQSTNLFLDLILNVCDSLLPALHCWTKTSVIAKYAGDSTALIIDATAVAQGDCVSKPSVVLLDKGCANLECARGSTLCQSA